MRKLIVVPIIHSEADLGTLALQIRERTRAVLGEEGWRSHQKAVVQFWRQVARHFKRKKVKGWHIFQDGLMVGGKAGLDIVRKGAEAGSPNHRLVLKLLKRGAVLERTEDVRLLKKEYHLIERMAKGFSLEKIFWSLWYKLCKGSLLRSRDKFIAKKIAETLGPKETGVLFIGAYHEVEAYLPKDIRVVKRKEPKVKRRE